MAVSITQAQEKLLRNGALGITQRWHPDVQRYCQGIERVTGGQVTAAQCMQTKGASYQAGVQGVSPQEVAARFQQGAANWAARYVQAFQTR